MKRTLLFGIATAFTGALSAQVIVLNENFDSYASGNMIAQTAGAPWNTWSQAPGGSEDAPLSDEQSYSAPLSIKVTGAAAGGPVDLILGLGDHSTGVYGLSFYMYVPAGNGGYFNLQHNEIPGSGSWMADVTFKPDGTVDYLVNSVTTAGVYTQDQWFNVIVVLDLNSQAGTIAIDGTITYSWLTNVPGPNHIGGVDFFAYAGGGTNVPLFYIDDVIITDLSGVGYEEAVEQALSTFPNPTEGNVTIEWAGASAAAVVEVLDVTGRVVVAPTTAPRTGAVSRSQVDLGAFPDGIYFVRLRDGVREEVRRVTKH